MNTMQLIWVHRFTWICYPHQLNGDFSLCYFSMYKHLIILKICMKMDASGHPWNAYGQERHVVMDQAGVVGGAHGLPDHG